MHDSSAVWRVVCDNSSARQRHYTVQEVQVTAHETIPQSVFHFSSLFSRLIVMLFVLMKFGMRDCKLMLTDLVCIVVVQMGEEYCL